MRAFRSTPSKQVASEPSGTVVGTFCSPPPPWPPWRDPRRAQQADTRPNRAAMGRVSGRVELPIGFNMFKPLVMMMISCEGGV